MWNIEQSIHMWPGLFGERAIRLVWCKFQDLDTKLIDVKLICSPTFLSAALIKDTLHLFLLVPSNYVNDTVLCSQTNTNRVDAPEREGSDNYNGLYRWNPF
jgi:hypothetical protein